MPYNYSLRRIRTRSKAGRELDLAYRQNKIGWAYYNKIWNKPKYWD